MNQVIGRSWPALCQKSRVIGIRARRMKKEAKTAGSVPMSKTKVQRISRKLFIARIMCYWRLQMFFIRFMRFVASWRAKIRPQIAKNIPGGVT